MPYWRPRPITTVDDIVAIFEMSDQIDAAGNRGMTLTSAAHDELTSYYFGEGQRASRLWSAACHEYDRRHMSAEDYRENYGDEE